MMSLITSLRTYNKRFFKKSFITLFTIAFLLSSISHANPLAIRAGQVAVGAFKNAMKNPKFASDTKALALALGLTYLTLPKDTTSTESNKLPKTFGRNCGIDGLVFSGVTMSEALNFFESYKDLKYVYTYRYEYSPHMMIDVYDVIGTKNGSERKHTIQCHNGGATNTSDFQDSVIDPSKHDDLANDIVTAAANGNSQAIELLKLAFSMSSPTMTQDEIDDLIEQLQKSAGATGTGTQAGTGTQTGTQDTTKDNAKENEKEVSQSQNLDMTETNSKLDKLNTSTNGILQSINGYINWVKTEYGKITAMPDTIKDEPVDITDLEKELFVDWQSKAEKQYIHFDEECPAGESFDIELVGLKKTFVLSYEPFCEYAKKIKPALIFGSYISALMIVVNGRARE